MTFFSFVSLFCSIVSLSFFFIYWIYLRFSFYRPLSILTSWANFLPRFPSTHSKHVIFGPSSSLHSSNSRPSLFFSRTLHLSSWRVRAIAFFILAPFLILLPLWSCIWSIRNLFFHSITHCTIFLTFQFQFYILHNHFNILISASFVSSVGSKNVYCYLLLYVYCS